MPGDHHSPRRRRRTPTVALDVLASTRRRRRPTLDRLPSLRRNATADAVAVEFGTDRGGHARGRGRGPTSRTRRRVLAALTPARRAVPVTSRREPGVGFDCSGLTAYAWAQAGVSCPARAARRSTPPPRVDESTAVAGDLVQYPGHVMMYLGVGDAIVHAANPRERRRARLRRSERPLRRPRLTASAIRIRLSEACSRTASTRAVEDSTRQAWIGPSVSSQARARRGRCGGR